MPDGADEGRDPALPLPGPTLFRRSIPSTPFLTTCPQYGLVYGCVEGKGRVEPLVVLSSPPPNPNATNPQVAGDEGPGALMKGVTPRCLRLDSSAYDT